VTGVNVLVFDEVDTGISGSVARAVGEKLRELAKYSQVLCITHLAQVASLADHHLVVNKSQDKLATTVVKSVVGEPRVDEIARMLSGHKVTEATRESARELLSAA
jgi:DNA repair protein RecN (Recombination protein N)